jgi:hypothetical protein
VESAPALPSRSADAPVPVPAAVAPETQVAGPSDAPGVPARDDGAITRPFVTARDGAAASVPPSVIPPLTAPDSNAVAEDVSAKQMFSPGVNAGLRYRLIQQLPGNVEADVDPATPFHSGDRVRFSFESNIDGFLYVVQQGSSGRWTVLFPHPEINGGRNAIRRFEQYNVPTDDWFEFDANPGTEQVFVFLSREPLNQLPGFDQPVTKTETVNASVVGALQASIKSRDLVLQKDRGDRVPSTGRTSQATYVVNRAEVGKAVAAVIELIHGR